MTETHAKARLRPVIRVFVSSTFSDMRNERNALQKDVYPKLEQLCLKNGFQFQAIDLRWGVSTEAGLDHRTMRICFDELRRAQEISPRPNFLILLGNRYGWRPLPEEISIDEYLQLERAALQIAPIVAKPAAITILRQWYHKDENAIPAVYILQSRRQELGDGKDYIQDAAWNDVQTILWEIINRATPPSQLQRRFDVTDCAKGVIPQIVRFQASATEQEIWQGAFHVPDAKEHVVAFFREIDNINDFAEPTNIKDFVDIQPSGKIDIGLQAEQKLLKAELLTRLDDKNVFGPVSTRLVPFRDNQGRPSAGVTTDHLAKLCTDVETRFTQIIQAQINEYWKSTAQASAERAVHELKIEQSEHERFSNERGGEQSFVGRDTELKVILDYLRNDSSWPLVVHGASGCGKTALLARASQIAKDCQPIVRFIGIMPRSSDLRSLLSSLCQELRLWHPHEDDLPTDVRLLEVELHEHFKAVNPQQPLILFLDALDQFGDTDGGRLLHWIPIGQLPSHVKLVVSCLSDRTEGDPVGQPYVELKRRSLPEKNYINLDALREDEAKKLLFDRWLPQVGRMVNSNQRVRIEKCLKSAACCQPIYLKLLFEEARLWRSYDKAADLGADVSALLAQLFERLSRLSNHGPLLVNRVLGYLGASRKGLAENEILEILFADPDYKTTLDKATETNRHEMPPNATRIPIAIWSRLRFDLAPYLTERAAVGANVLTFYHRQVAEWVQDHYAKESDKHWQPHALLATYFRNLADPEGNQTWKGDNPRPFLQVVFHLVGAESSDDYCQTLCDLRFVEARCRVDQVFELIADYRLAQANLPEAQVDLREVRAREELVRQWTAEIVEYAKVFNNQIDSTLKNQVVADAEPKLPESPTPCRMWTEEEIHIECERIQKRATRRDQLLTFSGFVSRNCYPLLEHGKLPGFVIQHAYNTSSLDPVHSAAETALKTTDVPMILREFDTIRNWNPRPALLLVLDRNEDPISSVCISSNGQIAVSGAFGPNMRDTAVRVWDATTGQCLHKLTGHSDSVTCLGMTPDARRVISGSSDKMLRVWNTETGECLRTIVGHKESIWGICITPDGSCAVSGSDDKTIRVWDLSTGRCLHTLLGHERRVSSVSMTADGRRVISASWDGTIRIWDPENEKCLRVLQGHTDAVYCVRVTLDGQRAVSSSEDKTLRLWNLATGECLRTIEGHRGATFSVSLTPDGTRAVSGSADKTIRVWNTETGECLRVLKGHNGEVNSVSMTPDGLRTVSGGGFRDNSVRVWDLERSNAFCEVERRVYYVKEDDIPVDKQKKLSRLHGGDVRLLDIKSGECIRVFRGHTRDVLSMCLSPDGCHFVSAGDDSTIRVWDIDTGRCILGPLRGHTDSVYCVSITPDGNHALSASEDETLRVWNLNTGSCVNTIRGHEGPVFYVHVTSDGKSAISVSVKTVRVWDVANWQCLAVFSAHGNISNFLLNTAMLKASVEVDRESTYYLDLSRLRKVAASSENPDK